ncbi:hypothetical protein CTEN210_11639 [Chaetoceros tenuissimus]|uniref:Uncharacterized protein n=1 Tax=Chaetoceros tenuissimus TaxID=426638 RepID=A0AAD3CZN9_9STRA|nr:hypothetical protein CTEN210_11639 [Chaetoceros tenuissimus]
MKLRILAPSTVAATILVQSSAFVSPPVINTRKSTHLNYVQSDESLEERLAIVKQSWEEIKSQGISNYFLKEIEEAEKSVEKSIAAAEKAAELAIKQKLDPASANKGIVEDLKAAEAISEAAATSAKSDAQAVKDLKTVSTDVVESMKKAEETMGTVREKIIQKTVDETDKQTLEASAQAVKKSIDAADKVADSVKAVVKEDIKEILELEQKGSELIKSIESVESTAREAATELGNSKVVTVLESTAKEVIEEMKAAESVAENMSKVAQADAAAVTSLDSKANDVITAITSVETAIDAATKNKDETSYTALKAITDEAVEKIKADEIKAEMVKEAVAKDAKIDEEAVETLKSADDTIEKMIKTAEDVVKGDTADTASNVKALESVNEAAINSIQSVEKKASECTDCAINEVEKAIESNNIVTSAPAPAVEPVHIVEETTQTTISNVVSSTPEPAVVEATKTVTPSPDIIIEATKPVEETITTVVTESIKPVEETITTVIKESTIETIKPMEEKIQEVVQDAASQVDSHSTVSMITETLHTYDHSSVADSIQVASSDISDISLSFISDALQSIDLHEILASSATAFLP